MNNPQPSNPDFKNLTDQDNLARKLSTLEHYKIGSSNYERSMNRVFIIISEWETNLINIGKRDEWSGNQILAIEIKINNLTKKELLRLHREWNLIRASYEVTDIIYYSLRG